MKIVLIHLIVIVVMVQSKPYHYMEDSTDLEIQPQLHNANNPMDTILASDFYQMKDDCDLCESNGPVHVAFRNSHLICHTEAELESPDYCHDCCLTEFDKCKYIEHSERVSPNYHISHNLLKEAVFRFKQSRTQNRPQACLTCVVMECEFSNDLDTEIYCIKNSYVCGSPYKIDTPQLIEKGNQINNHNTHQQDQSNDNQPSSQYKHNRYNRREQSESDDDDDYEHRQNRRKI